MGVRELARSSGYENGALVLLAAVLSVLSAGCDSMFTLRVDVRDGPAPTVRLAEVADVERLGGEPVEGASVQWAVSLYDLRSLGPAYKTRKDGTIGPLQARGVGDVFITCSKPGRALAWGVLTLDRQALAEGKETVLVLLPRLAGTSDAGQGETRPQVPAGKAQPE